MTAIRGLSTAFSFIPKIYISPFIKRFIKVITCKLIFYKVQSKMDNFFMKNKKFSPYPYIEKIIPDVKKKYMFFKRDSKYIIRDLDNQLTLFEKVLYVPLGLAHNYLNPKRSQFIKRCIIAPIFEELIFRECIQNIFLRNIPRYFLGQIFPVFFNSTIEKVIRVVITSLSFSIFHRMNVSCRSRSKTARQLFYAFNGGLTIGALRESEYGLIGAIVEHSIYNSTC